jgi:hypothetical protein
VEGDGLGRLKPKVGGGGEGMAEGGFSFYLFFLPFVLFENMI